ncbi:flippase-like domain-containing protein [Candidatus Saccharibacteria bacterium]|nr:flippase-like domain-containing protein [Candidatus Saccharibacteria bacterium]MBQ6149584.1 flippase-like domain-containing protein [Candidatus Saccharibacteria bacterium]
MAKKRKFKFPWRTIISIATIGLVGYVVYQNWDGFVETFDNLNRTNIFVLLLLVPEQLFMYYACGQIFFSYLENKYRMVFGRKEKLKISTELNFVNRAVPAGALGGLAYLTYRMRPFGVTAGQASFLYIFRFGITTVVNYVQALIAVLVLLALGSIPEEATWIIWVSLLMNMGVFTILGLIIYVASSKKRIEWFAMLVGRLIAFVVRVVTFGHKKSLFRREKVQDYFLSIHDCVVIVKKDKKSLYRPTMWGFIYSLCEIGVYWIVACAMGRPEILPVIMVGEAIGSVFDGIVPYGPYELGMAGVMGILLGGTEEAIAVSLIVTVMARALSLIFTILTGYWPYQQAIRGKEDGKSNS